MFTTLIYTLAGGMLAVVATGRTDQIAWRFLRLVGLLVFAMLCGVTVWHIMQGPVEWEPRPPLVQTNADNAHNDAVEANGPGQMIGPWSVTLGAGCAAIAIAVVLGAPLGARFQRLFRGLMAVGGVLGIGAAILAGFALSASSGETSLGRRVAVSLNQVTAAALLGSITVAWLLGHAYLTATRMTIGPLRHFSRMLSWAVGCRFMFLAISLGWLWWLRHDATNGMSPWWQVQQAWLVVSLRVGVGLIAVAVFAYMVADCVRLRSTQSATGILYFGSVFAYVGELASQYLMVSYGWPL